MAIVFWLLISIITFNQDALGQITLYDPSMKLDKKAIEGKPEVELILMRNEIFARHGRVFKTPWIRMYFNLQV